jgi:two-component system, response regulator
VTNPLHLLLVEDNKDDYEAIVRSFKRNDFLSPIQWCKNGQDALNYLHKSDVTEGGNSRQPDLIMLDLNMPGIDGRQVLTSIKHDDKLKKIPVIVFTTSADNKDVEQCYIIGVNTYIQKPVNFEQLVGTVRIIKDYWFSAAVLSEQETEGWP